MFGLGLNFNQKKLHALEGTKLGTTLASKGLLGRG
jgi:hypothetical protein